MARISNEIKTNAVLMFWTIKLITVLVLSNHLVGFVHCALNSVQRGIKTQPQCRWWKMLMGVQSSC